ncbi:DUF2267 domain-containing protein [Umezakia ovalisporum]|jgi:uncharacterized protein (DUF2267 family)|uniref:DUF2267 domain-containing protein n=2 Tax=Umezakia ovalisporum TaxID=75695 RepID=A0AA43KF30_9CYAN|nr:DUF2267 domain-containing protein [Umezakia ovalisporum]MBI1242496.1 DUF2267 domain-containing protein [Nostoc sp. RI_552]MDH6057429.1 DUF2267 domain-containing protein [Umezakia ovalisporum FSS-43]MDH6064226.1 DUF2267 domain-containing protein [Umezakia ovalisporum FSS-62]MDH6065941.1 DUF2267 domain-containing protein [Umezakia ovalisporum APH033B]MDH6070819.1 DUF2267 domain-containing protein [Umezakia ovalisporum CobakiLakeA]
MEYKEFITHVQSVAQSNSREEAERATRATLETLTERIPREETNEIAAELPQELGQYLQGREGEPSESFNLQEFISRVSQRENIEPTTTAIHVRAVFAVLQNAIKPEKFAKFHDYFPHDYEELFTTAPTSEIPAM